MPQEYRLNIDETADVHPSAILEGNITIGAFTKIGQGVVIAGTVTIGHHTLVQCNTVIRGTNTIGNWVHIYDQVCIEGGRPALSGSSTAETPDRSIIGDECWLNHGATMHGSRIDDGGALCLNACLDYNCHIGKGAIVTNGSACRLNAVMPANCIAEGVPARVVKENITDDDRRELMVLVSTDWVRYAGEQQEKRIRASKGLPAR